MSLSAGTRLGPYEILAPLGAGGMGEVYRAKDPRLSREVAIKVLPSSFSQDPERLRRFEQEAKAAGVLNHPNITAVYDIGTHDGSPYVVTELLEGETLRSRLAGGPLPERKAIDYALQIAHGLAAAHEKGIVHRDLKPENLFLTRDGRVKILDFGLAKLTRPEDGGPQSNLPTAVAETEPGVVLGTLGYMSPEQVRGKPADHRSDIFAFGAILHEMLMGRRAFHGDSAADTMSAILKEDPPSLSEAGARVPPALERIVQHCLEKAPEERFQSARDMAFALRDALPESATSKALPAAPRFRFRLGVASVLAASLLVAVVLWLLWRDVGGFRGRPLSRAGPPDIQSLAVLPLENLSRDPEQEYFADGMTEAIIADLTKIRALRVISRTSAMQYKDVKKPLPQIARELNVDAVVEGSVLRSGDRVRITAQLIHAPTDRHLWADSYERDLRDVLALQRDIAQAIAQEIKVTLTPQEQAQLAKARPVDPEAHQLYLKGRYHWNKRTAEDFKKALEYFQQAIAKDPSYPPAYAGLADTYGLLGYYAYDVLPPREAMPKAKAAALKALEIDGSFAQAHVSLAWVRQTYDWDWPAAEKEFKRAIDLNPGYATAHHWYSLHLATLGRRDEALAEAKRALELDPLSIIINHIVGLQHYWARRFDQAIEQFRKTIDMDPSFPIAHWSLGRAYAAKGMYREAIAEYEKYSALTGGSGRALAALGSAHARSGDRREALRVLEQLNAISKQRYVPSHQFADVSIGLGDKDQAFAWLDKVYDERSSYLTWLKVEPLFDPLRSDPRFADLVRRVGLPQ